MQIRSLGQEDPLEEEMATHSSIFAWEISQTEEPGGLYSPWGHKELQSIGLSGHARTHKQPQMIKSRNPHALELALFTC